MAFTVPCELTARLQIGNFISVKGATSRHPASMISPFTPRARSEVASSSPKYPSVQNDVGATTRMLPGVHTSTATWIIRLSPGGSDTVTAGPAMAAPG